MFCTRAPLMKSGRLFKHLLTDLNTERRIKIHDNSNTYLVRASIFIMRNMSKAKTHSEPNVQINKIENKYRFSASGPLRGDQRKPRALPLRLIAQH